MDTRTLMSHELMRRHQVRRLPVLDAADRLLGILSLADIARRAHFPERRHDALSTDSVARTLAACCEAPASESRAA